MSNANNSYLSNCFHDKESLLLFRRVLNSLFVLAYRIDGTFLLALLTAISGLFNNFGFDDVRNDSVSIAANQKIERPRLVLK